VVLGVVLGELRVWFCVVLDVFLGVVLGSHPLRKTRGIILEQHSPASDPGSHSPPPFEFSIINPSG
jgi:hypothetical protein